MNMKPGGRRSEGQRRDVMRLDFLHPTLTLMIERGLKSVASGLAIPRPRPRCRWAWALG
jgi:hypothetical protein